MYKSILLAIVFLNMNILAACSQNKNTVIPQNQLSNTMEKVEKTDEQWKKELSSEQYYVLREKGTERPFTGSLLENKEKGVYKCAGCGSELFSDDMKFDSECGWPSFDKEIAGGKIIKTVDKSHGMSRTEITCAKCGGHLGHLFDDGPTQTGQRYCVNSLSLEFEKTNPTNIATPVANNSIEQVTLGGGCYWCVEAVYLNLKGVTKVESGFSGGKVKNPSYREVCNGTTGHAEVIQITYNPAEVSFTDILKVFFTVHDPTTLNRQGADVGTQYRSAIFYHNAEQAKIAKEIIAELTKEKVFSNPIVTEVTAFDTFYKAQDDHQNYYNNNKDQQYCQMVIAPKLAKFEKVFKDKMKK